MQKLVVSCCIDAYPTPPQLTPMILLDGALLASLAGCGSKLCLWFMRRFFFGIRARGSRKLIILTLNLVSPSSLN
jgi:hypothetical protein